MDVRGENGSAWFEFCYNCALLMLFCWL